MTRATLGDSLECEILTLEGWGGLVPGWSRKCPLGVPLVVYILTLTGPDPFSHAGVGVGRGSGLVKPYKITKFTKRYIPLV